MSDAMDKKCFARHIGTWAVEESWMSSMIAMINSGTVAARPQPPIYAVDGDIDSETRIGAYTADGVRIIPIMGGMMKQFSKYGGTSYIGIRQELRYAARNPDIAGIMLHMDTPGGNVSGLDDLAMDIKSASLRKPLAAHVDDCCCSAGVWLASQAPFVMSNKMAEHGSIGVYTILTDTSAQMEMDGVRVIKVASSKMKGEGAPGLPITDDHLAEVQATVDRYNHAFKTAIMSGRKMNEATYTRIADGRTFDAKSALDAGLIDAIGTFDASMERMLALIKNQEKTSENKQRGAAARVRVATLRGGR